jgi:hypothetical protein
MSDFKTFRTIKFFKSTILFLLSSTTFSIVIFLDTRAKIVIGMANINQRRGNANYVGNKGIPRIDVIPNSTDDRETPKALATTGPIANGTPNNHAKIMKEADSEIYSNEQNEPFMYMPVKCGETNIAALIDTGSSINTLSTDLFNSLPENCKSRIYPFHEEIKLANGHHIKIIGTADLKIRTDNIYTIKAYLFPKTSHPMILGMKYLRSKHISIILFRTFPLVIIIR